MARGPPQTPPPDKKSPSSLPANVLESCHTHWSSTHLDDDHLGDLVSSLLIRSGKYPSALAFSSLLFAVHLLPEKSLGIGILFSKERKQRIHLYYVLFLYLVYVWVQCKLSTSVLISQYIRVFHHYFGSHCQEFVRIHFALPHF